MADARRSQPDVSRPGDPCQPGDITVTPVARGFMIRRVLRHLDNGPWWHYIATFEDHRIAVSVARWFARSANVRAWLHQTDDTYKSIPLGSD